MLSIEDIERISAAVNATNQPVILHYIGVVVFGWIGAFIAAYLVQKAKNQANSENFDNLKSELDKNTRIVKEIESNFSENSWIKQQVWLKKQESYETILGLIRDIEKYVRYQVTEFEEWQYVHMRHPYFGFYHHEDIGNKNAWEKDKKDYEEKKKNPETAAESEGLKTRYDKALSEIFDHISLKAIYLDSAVESEMEKLKQSLSWTDTEEDWEDHFERISRDTMETIKKVREISHNELKLGALNSKSH
jgi:uncharacterized membrane-anchored protein YhcB (DUF1043 family)